MPPKSPSRPIRTVPRRRRPVNPARSHSFRSQLRRHSVALISLAVAIVSLGYNTWRNETSEVHRNWRQAAFQITIEANQLQQFVLYRRYFHDQQDHALKPMQDADTWIGGWAKAMGIRDLTSLLPEPLPERGQALFNAWQNNAGKLDDGGTAAEAAEEDIIAALEDTREAVLELIDQMR